MLSALAMMYTEPLPLVAAFLMAVGVALVLWGAMGALATRPATVPAADAPALLRVALAGGALVLLLVAYFVVFLAYYLGVYLFLPLVLGPAVTWLWSNFPYLTICLIVALSAGAVRYLAMAWRRPRSRAAPRVPEYDLLLELPATLLEEGVTECLAALPDFFGLHFH